MTRRSLLVIGVATYIGVVGADTAMAGYGYYQEQARVNGDPNVTIFDANRNNYIGDKGDCIVNIFAIGSTLTFSLTQTESYSHDTVPLRICEPCNYNSSSAVVTATASLGLGNGDITFTDACPSDSFGDIPVFGAFSSSPTITSPVTFAGTGGGAGEDYTEPVQLGSGLIRSADFPFDLLGTGFLCNAGGRAAAQITDDRGVSLLVDVLGNGYGYACVPVPLQRADTYKTVFIKGCFPIDEGNESHLTLDGTDVANADLDNLPPCTLEKAPTSNEFTLMAIAVGLVGVGAWLLGRRKGFSEGLPQP